LRLPFQRGRGPNGQFIFIFLRRLSSHKLFRLWSLMGRTIRIGTRGSQLALWQARWVQQQIDRNRPGSSTELVIIKTTGDKITDVPLAKVGGKGLFVKEIEEALLDGRIDIAVHSMKDMPADIPDGLCIGAVPPRENPLDALISKQYATIDALPKGARVGTSSLRRTAQLLHRRPDLTIAPLRGNLDTRLNKLADTDLDAIILAAAGLKRLGLADRITAFIEPGTMLPAVGQGALCIENRNHDSEIGPVVANLDHGLSHTAISAERAFSRRLEGGCQVPIAAYAAIDNDRLHITGLVADTDGRQMLKHTLEGPSEHAAALGLELAEHLLAQGAGPILERLTQHVQ
jgi:hydroxymethylbilane synthase